MARPEHNLETPAEPPTTCGATLGGRYPLLPYIIRGKKGSVDSMYLCSCLPALNLVTWTATRYMWQSLCKIWGPNHHIFMLLFLAVKDKDKDKNNESDLVIQWLSDTVDCSWQIEKLESWYWWFVTDRQRVVSYPTRWSLFFIFGFLYGSSYFTIQATEKYSAAMY